MVPISAAERGNSGVPSTHGITTRFTMLYFRRVSSGTSTPLPPHGSHYGGVSEHCIRTTRKVLRALLQTQTVDDEGLVTLLCAVESIINGRPITTVSSDSNDPDPLTPNYLLLLRSEPQMSPALFQRKDSFSRRRWLQVRYLSDIFWKRWSKEYLPLLQSRQKWMTIRKNLAVGDIVLVSAENSPRNSWPLVRVVEVFTEKKKVWCAVPG